MVLFLCLHIIKWGQECFYAIAHKPQKPAAKRIHVTDAVCKLVRPYFSIMPLKIFFNDIVIYGKCTEKRLIQMKKMKTPRPKLLQ